MQFPEGFIQSLKDTPGFDEQQFISAHDLSAPVSIRINGNKLDVIDNTGERVPWCTNAFYLPYRPVFTLDPLFHAGAFYVQEASSMFLDHILKIVADIYKPIYVLDLCAAPGGKSTLIASAISADSVLVSNEVIKQRVNVLKENIVKWGSDNIVVTHNDPSDFGQLKNYFDIIVADVPCSGSGLFRKDKEAVNEWSMENVLMCSKRQIRIIEDIIPALKPGGILIYSTCSYSVQEDEDIIKLLISKHGFETLYPEIDPGWNIVKDEYGFRFYPDKIKGEGFFISVLRKTKETDEEEFTGKPYREKVFEKADKNIIEQYLSNADDYDIFASQNFITVIRRELVSQIQYLHSVLKVIRGGVYCGEIKGKDFIPSHELALSNIISKNIPAVELDKEDALRYLRKQDIKNMSSPDKGWCLVTYQQINLGWIKLLENRINNYYPMEWRIRNL